MNTFFSSTMSRKFAAHQVNLFFCRWDYGQKTAPSPTVRVDVEITQTTTVEIIGTDSYCSISEREA